MSLRNPTRLQVFCACCGHAFAIALVGVTAALVSTVGIRGPHFPANSVTTKTDGAFRDGLFLGRFDVEHGRKLRLTSGRWSTDADRQLFVTAYLQAYRNTLGGPTSDEGAGEPAAEKGYRDGIVDGFEQRASSGTFQMNSTENYRQANHGYSESVGELIRYQAAYREAYCNGYQEAYYAKAVRFGGNGNRRESGTE
jgi:hypothetical protein